MSCHVLDYPFIKSLSILDGSSQCNCAMNYWNIYQKYHTANKDMKVARLGNANVTTEVFLYLILSCLASFPLTCIISVLSSQSHISLFLTHHTSHICYMLHPHVLLLISHKHCLLLFHSLIHMFHSFFIFPSILPHTDMLASCVLSPFPPRLFHMITTCTYDSLVLKSPVLHQGTPVWFSWCFPLKDHKEDSWGSSPSSYSLLSESRNSCQSKSSRHLGCFNIKMQNGVINSILLCKHTFLIWKISCDVDISSWCQGDICMWQYGRNCS